MIRPSAELRCSGSLRQQKCLAHVLRSISMVQAKVGRGRSFGKRLSELLNGTAQNVRGVNAWEKERRQRSIISETVRCLTATTVGRTSLAGRTTVGIC